MLEDPETLNVWRLKISERAKLRGKGKISFATRFGKLSRKTEIVLQYWRFFPFSTLAKSQAVQGLSSQWKTNW